ncbi:MAG: hemolysin secretion protein, partial [Rubritepida sp.]|nr:hemolysin secretion protein [Rubritepida sp.]
MTVMKPRPEGDAAPALTSPAPSPRADRRRWVRRILFLLLPLALIAAGYLYVEGGRIMSTENAYVRADMVGVSTDVSGIVKDIAVRENQTVALGDVLFRL